MNKKVVIIFSAILAFFAGAIWVSEVPVVATLVAFLEICAGFGCGFYYCKHLVNEEVVSIKKEMESVREASKAVAAEKKVKIAAPKRTAKNTTAKA